MGAEPDLDEFVGLDVVKAMAAADVLGKAVHEITDDRQWPGLNALQAALTVYNRHRHPNQGSTPMPFTAIDERIARASWVLRRLVACLGFQATLTCYGGDYMEHGTTVNRGVRINVLRNSFDGEHLRELTLFADEHDCDLEVSQEHGATLRLKPILEERFEGPEGATVETAHTISHATE